MQNTICKLTGMGNDPSLWNIQFETFRLKENELVFKEGDIATGLFYLKSGAIRVMASRNTKPTRTASAEHLIKLVAPGEFFGYKAVVKAAPYFYFASTVSESEIIHIPLVNLDVNQELKQQILCSLLVQSVTDLEDNEMNYQIQYMASVPQRIAFHLIQLADKFGKQTEHGIQLGLRLSRKDLAQIAGTIDESLSRHLNNFKDLGYVNLLGREIFIKNLPALRDFVGKEYDRLESQLPQTKFSQQHQASEFLN